MVHYFDLGPDGRPVLIVLLNRKRYMDSRIFYLLMQHMPQGYKEKTWGGKKVLVNR